MKVAVFSSRRYDREFLDAANATAGHQLAYFDVRLEAKTIPLAAGSEAVCVLTNDTADAGALKALAASGIRLVALRGTGFNNVDLEAAAQCGIKVVRVTTYSPYSVAEHAVTLLLALNRKIHRAYNRTRESNFVIDGLMGFDLHGKTVAVVGTGKIGRVFARIMLGFGCKVLEATTSLARPNSKPSAPATRNLVRSGQGRGYYFPALSADTRNTASGQCRYAGPPEARRPADQYQSRWTGGYPGGDRRLEKRATGRPGAGCL